MKTRLLFLVALLLLSISCKNSDSDPTTVLKLSQSTFDNLSSANESLKVTISSNTSWSISSNSPWCTPDITQGEGNQTITLAVTENTGQSARTAKLTITAKGYEVTETITINQPSAVITENSLYKLPVIFHVFYKNKNDRLQNVEKGRLQEMLGIVNKLYKNAGVGSVDMNLEFTLATHDQDGKLLSEPGVERILWNTDKIDMEEFMSSNERKYNYLLWDPNQYINVMIFNFTRDDLAGVSHFPYTPKTHPLVGTGTTSYSALTLGNLSFAYCLSINSSYIYENSAEGLNQNDAAITLAHELGHYLGIYHVFSEGENGEHDLCKDTDYCEDTPTYNKKEYDDWVDQLPPPYTSKVLAKRYDCTRGEFLSRNIMDYSFGYLDEFTSDQRKRVRHILQYSPLIPGPKDRSGAQTRAPQGPIDLPIRVMY